MVLSDGRKTQVGPQFSNALGCPVPLSGPQAAGMTLARATRHGFCRAHRLRSDRFPCPARPPRAGPNRAATVTSGQFLAWTPMQDTVKHVAKSGPMSSDPPESSHCACRDEQAPSHRSLCVRMGSSSRSASLARIIRVAPRRFPHDWFQPVCSQRIPVSAMMHFGETVCFL